MCHLTVINVKILWLECLVLQVGFQIMITPHPVAGQSTANTQMSHGQAWWESPVFPHTRLSSFAVSKKYKPSSACSLCSNPHWGWDVLVIAQKTTCLPYMHQLELEDYPMESSLFWKYAPWQITSMAYLHVLLVATMYTKTRVQVIIQGNPSSTNKCG